MKSKLLAILSAFLSWPFALSIMAHAGQTVMSTSDSAPLYPTSGWNKNTEVVIGTASSQTSVTTTVTLTTTSNDGGAVFVSYTPGDGITEVSNTGWGTSREVVTYSFLSSCIGNVNTISINASHDGTELDVCSNGTSTGYTICIPKITAARTSGNTTTNTFEKYSFQDDVTIVGCDDFDQIEWVQMLTEQSSYTDYAATSHTVNNFGSGTIDWPGSGASSPPNPSGWASPGGSSGWPMSVSGETATFSSGQHDVHQWDLSSTTGSFQIGGAGAVYYYAVLASDACTFQDKIRRKSGSAALGEYDWSFTWQNHDSWQIPPNVPTLPQYGLATGNVSGAYGGTARTGTGANVGGFSNVQNMTLP